MRSSIPGMYEESCELNKKRNDIISDMVYDNIDTLVNGKDDKVLLTRTISDMLYNDMMSRIMVFEGTGDLTFYNSNLFRVLSVENLTGVGGRYSSPIYIREPIPFNIKRSYRNQKEFLETKGERDMEWSKTLDIVESILNSSEIDEKGNIIPCTGTLIQTWKGYSIRNGDPLDYIETKTGISENMLSDIVKENLILRGIKSKFDVIHFMSGLDKATNEFRDFNRVIILGNLQVPNSVVNKFNQDYRVNTTPALFRTYQLSQLVCRTCIRKHNGDPIFIYYTSDINPLVIDRMTRYLTNSNAEDINNNSVTTDELSEIGISNKWKPVVELFCSLDPEFKRSLICHFPYTITLTLDEIFNLIPMSKKETAKYNSLVNYLKKFNILLDIKSWTRSK